VGYSKDFAAGVICNAGTLGILIPPSIVMVVYASATDVSVGRMFLAGVIPGLMAGLHADDRRSTSSPRSHLPKGEWRGWGEIFDVLGARRGLGPVPDRHHPGRHLRRVFTPTEAAAVAAVYAFFIANFVYRDMGPLAVPGRGRWGRRPRQPRNASCWRPWALVTAFFHRTPSDTLFEAGKLTVTLMFIIANALILKHVLTDEQIPQQIAGAMLERASGR
jgi:C4-dicarboxylate transporter DctM subunit